jgi:hypothetical protein
MHFIAILEQLREVPMTEDELSKLIPWGDVTGLPCDLLQVPMTEDELSKFAHRCIIPFGDVTGLPCELLENLEAALNEKERIT